MRTSTSTLRRWKKSPKKDQKKGQEEKRGGRRAQTQQTRRERRARPRSDNLGALYPHARRPPTPAQSPRRDVRARCSLSSVP